MKRILPLLCFVGACSPPVPETAEPAPAEAPVADVVEDAPDVQVAPTTLFLMRGRLTITTTLGGTTHTAYASLYDGGLRTTDVESLAGLEGATNIVHESWRADDDADQPLAEALASGPFATRAPYTELRFTLSEAAANTVVVAYDAAGRERVFEAAATVDPSSRGATVHLGPVDVTSAWTSSELTAVSRSVGGRGGSTRAELELVVSSDSRRAGIGARAPATTAVGDSDGVPLWREHTIESDGRRGVQGSLDLHRSLEDGLTPAFVNETGR